MKNRFKLFLYTAIILVVGLIYLIKIHNPTAFGWQTNVVTYLTKLTDVFYLPYWFKSSGLPVYELTLNPDDYVFLNRNLPDPKATGGILADKFKQFVPASFDFEGRQYQVRVRYRGVDFDHWTRPKKSWRVNFGSGQPFFGQTAINLIIPEDRGMYLEELSNYRAKKMGLIVPESRFVVLKVNGQTEGVYWQTEQWNEAFLEKNDLPIGNLYGEIDQEVRLAEQQPIFASLKFWRKYSQDEVFAEDNYTELSLLLDLLNNVSDEEFFTRLPYILDIDNFIAWQAHSVLMGSIHQDHLHNFRLYWHPALGKFMVMPWDVLGGVGWPANYHPLASRVLKNPDWLAKRNQILAAYVNNPDNLADDLAYYDQLAAQTKTAVFQDYKKFFSNIGYLRQLEKTRRELISQFQLIQQKLDSDSLPDEVSGFPLPVTEPIDVADPAKSVIESEFADFDQLFLTPKQLTFGPGTHLINQTRVIPPGYQVRLLPGARLSFAEGASFVSLSPVTANGATLTTQDPDKPWGVFAVLGESANGSSFNGVTVEYGSEAIVNGAYFSGALAAHGADNIVVSGSTFRFNRGDDGLNVKYADVSISNNIFADNDFDGLDLDFATGLVAGNRFLSNGNDGMDFGSASPDITGNLVDGAGDKCLSLGETASPKVTGNTFKNCNMGIAVKDSSQPEISGNTISDNHIGLASYLKKPIFPRKEFIFKDNQLIDNEIDFEEEGDYRL
ncbi:MAG: hypothetical protein UX85_C0006G0015 [Candidatus Beckwithbacteria bacterium GW2011_GWB1_47_15]|uniref:Periplasmic copper-binding protein NosD beta helix domain-containing protein n=1 Tax=Candidatus Beckwithbacteria bacterium GW2011_GWB1_47_15 TaxID=1618371 RepID=A0A0G1RUU9_9BACT|nr:MAG: hypothetical protein UY43_C0001G0704 [Candidatus Beckwithbacteria bacterium GW2011_GWC1_49_16]KKU35682.1 MAG: hypothetical protein UX50_C0002G0109 [Candidatus Beckwithbacteria bacterium GW2011_GWA1_46_30]KKU60881.1 MAG: hypothetical protein UX85_C0006G0015 [Candidatus Beckwithbacteria bacterium GW2011_GWB1_47_15]KKU72241.1 MAG: hypothetical protein UX97_C0001G0111 [Candidatus Beckwithbacteria bacterium GW2011_GWA2_47_25]KKW04999.1 MAG: hypothetical protein UY37_C0001G0103 [Candidatus Be